MANSPDGKWVVVRKDGARISGILHESKAEAEKEVQKLTESVQTAPGGTPEFNAVQLVFG